MPPRNSVRGFLDEGGDDDAPPSSPTRRKAATAKKAAAKTKARQDIPPVPPQEPPERMPRLTRGRAAETGERPIPGTLNPDRLRRRPEPQGASPPARPSLSRSPSPKPTRIPRPAQGRGGTRAEHPVRAARPYGPSAHKSVHFKARAQARHGRGGHRLARPRSQVHIVDVEPEVDADDDHEHFDNTRSLSPPQHMHADHDIDYEYDPAWFEDDAAVDEHDGEGEPVNGRHGGSRARSARFSVTSTRPASRGEARARDDARSRDGSSKRSHPLRNSRASVTDISSPPHKRQYNENYAHFKEGREVDPVMSNIPNCARRIILAGHKEYLCLHYFDPDVRVQERRAQLVARGTEREPTPIRVRVTEDDMTTGMYSSWARQHVAALRALGAPPWCVRMFDRHYEYVQSRPNYESAWTTWREYDLARRAQVVGDFPPDIGTFSAALYRQVEDEANARLRELLQHAVTRTKAAPSTSGAAVSTRSGASNASAGPSSARTRDKTDTFRDLKYAVCILCGSAAHQMSKDGRAAKSCSASWLVWDSKRAAPAWTTPDTHKIVCWAWNGPGGCSRDPCRLANGGHRCSLCGSSAHTCHTH